MKNTVSEIRKKKKKTLCRINSRLDAVDVVDIREGIELYNMTQREKYCEGKEINRELANCGTISSELTYT